MTTLNPAAPSLFRKVFEPLVLAVLLAFLWELLARLRHWDPAYVPPPSKVVLAVWEFHGQFMLDAIFTFAWILGGFFATLFAALFTAIVVHTLPQWMARPVYSLLVMLQSVPVFAIIPALAFWTGIGAMSRITIIALVAFFPVLVNTVEGLRQIDPNLVDLFDSMNATRWQKLLKLELPSALAMVLAGAKITLTMCAIGVVVAEMAMGERKGLGYRPKEALQHFRMDEAFAAVLLLALIVNALYQGLHVLFAKLYPSRTSL